MFDLPTILKPNATEHDRALEQAIRKGKPDLTPIAKLMNPETCPAHLLGWLAWAFSVDVWETTWSETTKREVIKRAIAVHRVKGTAGAVRRALASLGMEIAISEWFEHLGDPHTFRIDVLIEEIFEAGFHVNPELVAEVDRVIDNVKPVRAHYALRLGERLETSTYARTGYCQRGKDTATRLPTVPTFTINAAATAATGLRERAFDRASFTPVERSAA